MVFVIILNICEILIAAAYAFCESTKLLVGIVPEFLGPFKTAKCKKRIALLAYISKKMLKVWFF